MCKEKSDFYLTKKLTQSNWTLKTIWYSKWYDKVQIKFKDGTTSITDKTYPKTLKAKHLMTHAKEWLLE
jgi:hypothetical protein